MAYTIEQKLKDPDGSVAKPEGLIARRIAHKNQL